MKVIIDISEELYNYMRTEGGYDEHLDRRFDYQIRFAVKDGIPLPKGHGDLIDKKVAYRKFYARCLASEAMEVFAETPVIIGADKEEE